MAELIMLDPAVCDISPDLYFRNKFTGVLLHPSTVNVDSNGYISSIVCDDELIYPSDFEYYKHVLQIPGIGYVTPDVRVIYKEKDYILKYGWHTNISNQEICSWYLSSLNESVPDKTLYKEMINMIDIVHFR